MMSVLEYALDINKNVNEVITLCKKLGIKVSSENDILEDEDIILHLLCFLSRLPYLLLHL